MSARPGRITRIVDVPLAQPRNEATREDPAYFRLITEVREALRAGGGLAAPEAAATSEDRIAAEGAIG
jgi:ABC-type nitrate/sulfonate/bicarbonate transport system ATPase subunit